MTSNKRTHDEAAENLASLKRTFLPRPYDAERSDVLNAKEEYKRWHMQGTYFVSLKMLGRGYPKTCPAHPGAYETYTYKKSPTRSSDLAIAQSKLANMLVHMKFQHNDNWFVRFTAMEREDHQHQVEQRRARRLSPPSAADREAERRASYDKDVYLHEYWSARMDILEVLNMPCPDTTHPICMRYLDKYDHERLGLLQGWISPSYSPTAPLAPLSPTHSPLSPSYTPGDTPSPAASPPPLVL